MTIGGIITMVISVGGVSLLFGWCLYKVLSTPGETEHIHGFEFKTPDENGDPPKRPKQPKSSSG